MKTEQLKEKVREVMQGDNCMEMCEALADAFFDSVNTDNEPYRKIGFYLLKAFLEDDVNNAMIALCGWSLESLMVKAKLLPDVEHIFYDGDEDDDDGA